MIFLECLNILSAGISVYIILGLTSAIIIHNNSDEKSRKIFTINVFYQPANFVAIFFLTIFICLIWAAESICKTKNDFDKT